MYIIEIIEDNLTSSNFYKVNTLEEFNNIESSDNKIILKVAITAENLISGDKNKLIKCKNEELAVMTCYHIVNTFRSNINNYSVEMLLKNLFQNNRNNLFKI